MSNVEIARLLREFKQMKKDTQDLRVEMLRIAVEDLGINRKVAQHMNLETFLDGYRAGHGITQSCLRTTDYQISALLRHCQETKRNARKLRVEMLRVAVEELGMAQDEALQANLDVFLYGYLVGQGMMQSWRKTGT